MRAGTWKQVGYTTHGSLLQTRQSGAAEAESSEDKYLKGDFLGHDLQHGRRPCRLLTVSVAIKRFVKQMDKGHGQ